MPNQKEIRTKIKSTKKTMKITLAMKLVAAAKVNKMQKKLLNTRPYFAKVNEIFSNLQSSLDSEKIEEFPLFKKAEQVKKVLVVAISSDRGLCGAYNANIIKTTIRRIKCHQKEGKEVKLIVVGRKAVTALEKQEKELGFTFTEKFMNLASIPTSTEAKLIAEKAKESFLNGEVDKVEVITTKFESLISNEVIINDFLPVSSNQLDESGELNTAANNSDVILEPDAKSLINEVTPMYTENKIYEALLEAVTSELASRMTAMSNATNNAKEVIKKLVLAYNKARQASITQEISEIVGGAAAL